MIYGPFPFSSRMWKGYKIVTYLLRVRVAKKKTIFFRDIYFSMSAPCSIGGNWILLKGRFEAEWYPYKTAMTHSKFRFELLYYILCGEWVINKFVDYCLLSLDIRVVFQPNFRSSLTLREYRLCKCISKWNF